MEINQGAAIDAPAGPEASAGLVLKVTPPRIQRDLLSRPRLLLGTLRLQDVPAVLIQAPAGYGKTSHLAQWRRESLGKGAIVLWLAASPADDPCGLLRSLIVAFRAAGLRPRRSRVGAARPGGGANGMLAEIAQVSARHRACPRRGRPPAPESLQAPAYLLRNLPPKLRALVGMRGEMLAGLGTSSPTASVRRSERRTSASTSTNRSNWSGRPAPLRFPPEQ